MKFTLNECLARINQVLNYPAVSYEDIYHFFDQAIEELNTSLKIALPPVSEMVDENTFDITEQENLIRLIAVPAGPTGVVEAVTEIPEGFSEPTFRYFCKPNDFSSRAFYKWNGYEWVQFDKIYGMYVDATGSDSAYTLVPISSTQAVWAPVDVKRIQEFDLTEYLPKSWWTLFIIPYVCFKFAVRNGDSGELFADEFTQGFQQLQSSYSVPNTVTVNSVAGKLAYKDIVKEHLHHLGARVATRAIFDNMRVGTGIHSVFGGFYETGGWGI